MTTHDHETRPGSIDESRGASAETPPAAERSTPPAPPDPATASTDPSMPSGTPSQALDGDHHRGPSSVAPADPSSAPGGPAVGGQTSATPTGRAKLEGAEDPRAERRTSDEEALFADDELADLRARWAAVQAAFVDDPKQCVEKADSLVTDLVDQLTSGFAHARSRLEEQWSRGEEASTEDLRLALMHYREFFERLLTV
jgi:hypothetical protein